MRLRYTGWRNGNDDWREKEGRMEEGSEHLPRARFAPFFSRNRGVHKVSLMIHVWRYWRYNKKSIRIHQIAVDIISCPQGLPVTLAQKESELIKHNDQAILISVDGEGKGKLSSFTTLSHLSARRKCFLSTPPLPIPIPFVLRVKGSLALLRSLDCARYLTFPIDD